MQLVTEDNTYEEVSFSKDHTAPDHSPRCGDRYIPDHPAVVVKTVAFEWHENGLLKVRLFHAMVVDRDLCGSAAVKGIEQL